MSVLGAGEAFMLASDEDADFEIERSLRFNGGDSANLSFSPSITNGTTGAHSHWTFSAWVKRTKLGVTNQPIFGAMNSSNREGFIAFNANDSLRFSETGPSSSSYHVDLHTSQKFRDLSAWYHIVVVYAYNQYTFDKARIYVNGVEVTQFATKTIGGGLYEESYINTNGANHYIGKYLDYSSNVTYGDMYLANVHFVAGYTVPVSTDDANGSVTGIPNAKYLTEFGEFSSNTGVWIPKEYKGTYPRDGGFHLEFSDNSSNAALGTDSSGNSNTWTVNSLSVASGSGNDSLIDTPTNYTAASGNNGGNYCTMNPLRNSLALSNGNLDVVGTSGWKGATGTIGMSSGKYYWEYGDIVSNEHIVGIVKANYINPASTVGTNDAYGYGAETGGKYDPVGGSNQSYGNSYGTGDTIGIAFDADNGNLYFYKNGTAQNSGTAAFTGLTDGPYLPSVVQNGSSRSAKMNFGQRPFAHTPPTGYVSLCTQNLDESAYASIPDGSTAFIAKRFTANASNQTITTNFSPDLVWVKSRANAYGNELYDIVRGTNRRLTVNTAANEQNAAGQLTAFNTDGFTLGSASSSNYTNNTGSIAWAWDAGSSTVSNPDGDITTSLRVNQSTGVSIAKYSFDNNNGNQTLGHGLGVIPDLVIRKDTDVGDPWSVYSKAIGFTQRGYLNTTAAWSGTTTFGSASATSAVNRANNMNSGTYVDWSFAAIAGFSAFGTYEGNGNASGPFVFTGFRPRWIMIKNIDNVGTGYDWFIFDTARDTYNVAENILLADEANAETDSGSLDILSNGFKIRTTTNGLNLNSHTHLYLAFAENPFKTARAR